MFFFDDISININMKKWWEKFTSNKNNIINLQDYLGKNAVKNGLAYWIV